MTQAERIREYVMETYIKPARSDKRALITFNSGDIHDALNLQRRYPAVCGAIDAQKFQDENGVKLVRRTGPDQGATAEWTFAV